MPGLTMETARQLLATTTTEDHLFEHAIGVSAAMGAMARHFGADEAYWKAVGYLHDYDYQQFPEEHLRHTEAPLREAGVDEESIRAILSHGWGLCSEVEPQTDLEKSLFTVDELTGLIAANARMRPGGLSDLEPSSVKKKFKDKKFAAKIDRSVIQKGCDLLGLDLTQVIALCIEGKPCSSVELSRRMQELVRRLKSHGYCVYYLSNIPQDVLELLTERGVLAQFDGGVASCEVQVNKPDPQIYKALLKKYQLKASECIFIDDRLENVQAAFALGFAGIQMKDSVGTLIRSLATCNVALR